MSTHKNNVETTLKQIAPDAEMGFISGRFWEPIIHREVEKCINAFSIMISDSSSKLHTGNGRCGDKYKKGNKDKTLGMSE